MKFRLIVSISVLILHVAVFIDSSARAEVSNESVCYGTSTDGRLEDGLKLPVSGKNFVSYSRLGSMAGRTFVHNRVHNIVVAAYASLAQSHPDRIFMYGETGWKKGGPFKPHKTHQNGLSVDFMVPVQNRGGDSVPLPVGILNKFGYAVEFDKKGRYRGYTIDWEAMAAHLKAILRGAEKEHVSVKKIIFAPEFQAKLFNTQDGKYLKEHVEFSTRPSWVRHDEHYHIDFDIPCEPL